MFQKSYSKQELKKILDNTAKRRGWDFSLMKTESQPVPWDYLKVVSLYLTSNDYVLDIGTGGGEKLLELSKLFKLGLGIDIDPEMIKVAKENGKITNNVLFHQDTEKLKDTPGKFDVILCRHAPFNLNTVSSHLKPRGYFITQEVGEKNMSNIKKVINKYSGIPSLTKAQFDTSELNLISFMEYNVEYIVKDVESLVFWLHALDILHADLPGSEILKNEDLFNKILDGNIDDRGFVTNEHRYLVIAQK